MILLVSMLVPPYSTKSILRPPLSNLFILSSQRRWSNPDSWPNGQLPQEKDDVAIASSWRMLLDITPPPLNRVFIYGELEFEDKRDYNFTANLVKKHHSISLLG